MLFCVYIAGLNICGVFFVMGCIILLWYLYYFIVLKAKIDLLLQHISS